MASTAAGCSTWRLFCPFTHPAALCSNGFVVPVSLSRRCASKPAPQRCKSPKRSNFRPTPDSTHDWVGPPNPLSNLRPIVYHISENETELEKRVRCLRQETEDWNHKFWTEQNISFSKEKDAFIISKLKAKGLSIRDKQGHRHSLNSEEMAVFYKSFLDKNRIRHANYNKEWYRRNFTITLLMAQVTLHKAWQRTIKRWSAASKT
ncbi:cytochrome c oxidase assembly factor 8 [Aulostomus maculatus]